jgi:hypothetical protein
MIPKPLQEFLRELVYAFARFAKDRLLKLPFFIAQSVTWVRLTTLAGFSLLSLTLLAVTVHIAKVQEAVRSTEERARDTSLNVNLVLSRMVGLCAIAERMLQSQTNFYGDLKAGHQILPVAALLQPPDNPGLAIITRGEIFNIAGNLDATADSHQWDAARWSEISLRIGREMAAKSESTLFLSLERIYRSGTDLNNGAALGGSLVIARAWRDATPGWTAVIVLLPLRACFQFLHLKTEDYHSGNYDYLVDGDGYLLAHPNLQSIKGTDAQGRSLRAASNSSEAGSLPINTRDSDWIAGGDMLTRAFSLMMLGKPTSVVLKNLTRQNRLTSYHLVDLQKLGVDGYQLGVVSGRGMTPLEGLTAPFLLRSPNSLTAVLRVLSSGFIILISCWLWLVSKIRTIQQDMLALERYVSYANADRLGLLPIPFGEAQPHVYTSMVGVVVSLDLPDIERSAILNLVEMLGDLAIRLREDGWIVSAWNVRNILAARNLHDRAEENSPGAMWSPSTVTTYFRNVAREVSGEVARLRISYGVGDIVIKATRKGSDRRASVVILGSCFASALHTELLLSQSLTPLHGLVVAAEEDLRKADLPLLGERFSENGEPLWRITLHESLAGGR